MFNSKTRYETRGLLIPFPFVNFIFRQYEEIMGDFSLYIAVVRRPKCTDCYDLIYYNALCAHCNCPLSFDFSSNRFSLNFFSRTVFVMEIRRKF